MLNSSAPLALARSDGFQQRVGGKVRDDQPRAFAHEFVERRAGVLALAEFYVDGLEGLAGEFARGVVVGGAHQRAGQRVVLGGNVLNGEGLARMRLPQHADLDRQRLGERGGGEEQGEEKKGGERSHDLFMPGSKRGINGIIGAPPLFGRERGRRAGGSGLEKRAQNRRRRGRRRRCWR